MTSKQISDRRVLPSVGVSQQIGGVGWNQEFTIGDTYYQVKAEMNDRPWDVGDLADEVRTIREAEELKAIWLSDLSKNDRKNATAFVQRYRVLALDDDGSIGMAESY